MTQLTLRHPKTKKIVAKMDHTTGEEEIALDWDEITPPNDGALDEPDLPVTSTIPAFLPPDPGEPPTHNQ